MTYSLNFKSSQLFFILSTHQMILPSRNNPTRQKGVVLFFSLIALVIMSLAAVALIRSVDTNNMIAGNLGFKQSTMFSSDTGAVQAMAWIGNQSTVTLNGNPTDGCNSSAGYSPCSTANAKLLVDADGVSTGITNPDAQGNTITYVVQRMCDSYGYPGGTVSCLKGPLSTVTNDKGINNDPFNSKAAPVMYRVTARVVGPKNTLSYVQTYVY